MGKSLSRVPAYSLWSDWEAVAETSFAMSNIMFFPLFRIAFEFSQDYDKTTTKWKTTKEWLDAIAKLVQEVKMPDPKDAAKKITVPIMARDSHE